MLASGPGVTRTPRARKPSAKLLAASELMKEEQDTGPTSERRQDFSGDMGGRPTPPPPKRKRRSSSTSDGLPAPNHNSRHTSLFSEHGKMEHRLEAIEELEAWQAAGSNSSSQESFDIKGPDHATYSRFLVQHPVSIKEEQAAILVARNGNRCRRKQLHPLRSPFS